MAAVVVRCFSEAFCAHWLGSCSWVGLKAYRERWEGLWNSGIPILSRTSLIFGPLARGISHCCYRVSILCWAVWRPLVRFLWGGFEPFLWASCGQIGAGYFGVFWRHFVFPGWIPIENIAAVFCWSEFPVVGFLTGFLLKTLPQFCVGWKLFFVP